MTVLTSAFEASINWPLKICLFCINIPQILAWSYTTVYWHTVWYSSSPWGCYWYTLCIKWTIQIKHLSKYHPSNKFVLTNRLTHSHWYLYVQNTVVYDCKMDFNFQGSFQLQKKKACNSMHVTSFSSISYWSNSVYWTQKRAQSGNIHYFGSQGKVDIEFQHKVKTLIHIITENRNRRTSRPVHISPLHPLHAWTKCHRTLHNVFQALPIWVNQRQNLQIENFRLL